MSANLNLIDDLGTVWDGGSRRLQKAFGSPASDEEFSTYVVKNMGFIAIHTYGRSCEVRLRPQLVTPVAYRALAMWMAEHAFDRVVTARYDTDWGYGMHGSKQAALDKIDAMLASSRKTRPGDYLMRALTKEELPRTTPMHQALHSLIDNWPTLSKSVHRDGLSNIIKQSLNGRYTLVDAAPDGRDLTFREIGNGFMSYNTDWVARSQGRPVDNLEDAAYGRWAAAGYREALRNGRPTICQVDAIMNTPKLGRARVRYARVLLPVRTQSGCLLLTSSILDPTIDLRVQLLDKTG